MTRTAARELAFLLCASRMTDAEPAEAVVERFFDRKYYQTLAEEGAQFAQYPNQRQLAYIQNLVEMVQDRRAELDGWIETYARGWRINRISRIAGTILRCAICEILYFPDVPSGTAINEAVELAKKYGDADTPAFVNGILGSFVRERQEAPTPPAAQAPVQTAEQTAEPGPEAAAPALE